MFDFVSEDLSSKLHAPDTLGLEYRASSGQVPIAGPFGKQPIKHILQVNILLTSSEATQIVAAIAVFNGTAFEPSTSEISCPVSAEVCAAFSEAHTDRWLEQVVMNQGIQKITIPWKQLIGEFARAAEEFSSDDPRLLNLEEGQWLKVIGLHSGWCLAADEQGNVGFCPPSYVLNQTGSPLDDDGN